MPCYQPEAREPTETAEVSTAVQLSASKLNATTKQDPRLPTKVLSNPESINNVAKQPDVIQLSKTLSRNGINFPEKE
ncbi:hypothetical protein ON010_g4999 [Phytophthora cinnamomi]|nr:hypothetical protein ON010_g4999 [Phytophthora cinnamomi]